MRLGFGLSQEQVQKLALTPELRLAIKVLQFSAVELSEYIEEQLVENPVLEIAEEKEEVSTDEFAGEIPNPNNSDIDWEKYFEEIRNARKTDTPEYINEHYKYENLIPQTPTLQEYLTFQLGLMDLTENETELGEFIIGNIDDNGYLLCSLREAAEKCDQTIADAEKIVKIIQGLEPPGVGARDLKECLLIQYEQLGLQNKTVYKIISGYLNDIACGRYMKVAKEIGISLNELQQAVDCLKYLDPKPGRKFSTGLGTRYIIPDVVVERVDHEYIILVNDVLIPRLVINPIYKSVIKEKDGDIEAKKYLESRLSSAAWLLKSIEQRRLTIYKVARNIVDYQKDFFEKGVRHLKPLTLKQVAQSLGIHESTVSRAISNKYMQTPRGVFDMKYFFSSGVYNNSGSITSAEAVKKIIEEIIQGENIKKPFSDQRIAEMLMERGIAISRRTVTKYREEMGILSTSHRRRY